LKYLEKINKSKKIKKIYKKSKLEQILKLSLKQCIIAPQKNWAQKTKKQKIFAEGLA
jgi:hypothetical protein